MCQNGWRWVGFSTDKKVMGLVASLAVIRVILTPGDLLLLSAWKKGEVIWLLL